MFQAFPKKKYRTLLKRNCDNPETCLTEQMSPDMKQYCRIAVLQYYKENITSLKKLTVVEQ